MRTSSSCRFFRGINTAASATRPPSQAATASRCPAVATILADCHGPTTALDWTTNVAASKATMPTEADRRPTVTGDQIHKEERDADQDGQPDDGAGSADR